MTFEKRDTPSHEKTENPDRHGAGMKNFVMDFLSAGLV